MELPNAIKTRLNDINAYTLAHNAGVQNPDSLESPGAKMLTGILADVVERVEYLDDGDALADADSLRSALDDEVHEVADNAPDVYTHARWLQFIDLAAYNADLDDYGMGTIDLETTTLTDVAGTALYVIARDVADACVTLIGDELESHIGEADKRAAALGAVHGRSAADWFAQELMGGRAPGDAAVTARSILTGIDDGDPEVLDTIPAADLSGQWADGYTVAQLLSDVDLDGFDPASHIADDIAQAYGEAFDSTAQAVVADIARSVIGAAD